jgi:DNA-binding transcriptional LysR family regulator
VQIHPSSGDLGELMRHRHGDPDVQRLLRHRAAGDADTDDLRHGRVDLELGGGTPDLPEFRSETLGTDPLAVVMRAGHPCAEVLDLPAYAAHPHVLVSRRGRLTAPIDDLLAEKDLHRKVIATVATVHSALRIAATSDALVTTTAILCRPLVEAFGLVTRPLPVESSCGRTPRER